MSHDLYECHAIQGVTSMNELIIWGCRTLCVNHGNSYVCYILHDSAECHIVRVVTSMNELSIYCCRTLCVITAMLRSNLNTTHAERRVCANLDWLFVSRHIRLCFRSYLSSGFNWLCFVFLLLSDLNVPSFRLNSQQLQTKKNPPTLTWGFVCVRIHLWVGGGTMREAPSYYHAWQDGGAAVVRCRRKHNSMFATQ
jgi:hypothetical protein